MLLHSLLRHVVKVGSLGVIYADGRRRDYGNGAEPRAVIRLQIGRAHV